MTMASTVLAAVVSTEFLAFGAAKLMAAAPMRKRAEHLGYTVTAYRGIGALEIAGAGGVLLGSVHASIGVGAGSALALLMCGAVAAHVRNGDGVAEIAPAAVTGMAAVAYAVTVSGVLP
ncbi:DoxX family protein [Nocardia araoensis]|uniref:DoxX family protein n=1 Tax=Nocardia araoensis TaxID=228600 RepID=UPI0002F79E25|nr:DoxX family protein [Nocardia araoensis]